MRRSLTASLSLPVLPVLLLSQAGITWPGRDDMAPSARAADIVDRTAYRHGRPFPSHPVRRRVILPLHLA